MFCEQCHFLFKVKYYLGGPPFRYSREITALEASSAWCQFCAILYEWLPKAEVNNMGDRRWPRRLIVGVPRSTPSNESMIRYGVKLLEQPDNAGWYILQLYFVLSSDLPIPPETPSFRNFAFIPVEDVQPVTGTSCIEENTGDISSLDQVNTWLNTCLEHHEHCNAYSRILKLEQNQSRPFRPTRLLEIRPKAIKLHLTENISYRYAALSHRWPIDPAKILRLSTTNQDDLVNNIPQSSSEGFSRVFADAVKVCRRLDIEYLWVDSLCILQSGDDGVDWRYESARMGDVYQYAVCTIAAESVDDPDEALLSGMFKMRNEAMLEPMVGDASFDLKVNDWGGPRPMIDIIDGLRKKWKTPRPGRYYLLPTNDWLADISNASLSRRGWVEQERILAPRILHFTSKQIYFDCYQTMANEVWPKGNPTYHKRWNVRPWTILQDLALHKSQILQETDLTPRLKYVVENPLASWFRIAYTYARTDLTIPGDKLVAISGLARGLQSYIGATASDYLAGIWVQSLPYGLLWYAPWFGRPNNKLIRPLTPYQAPSWSWASVNWGLTTDEKYHSQPHDVLISLESFNIAPKSGPFGEVEPHSCIVLKACTYKISLSWGPAQTNYSPAPKFWPYIRLGIATFANAYGDLVCPDERYIEGESRDRNDLRLLPVLQSKAGHEKKWVQALILEPTGEEGEYRRFGYMNITSDGGRWWFQLNTGNSLGAMITSRKTETVTII